MNSSKSDRNHSLYNAIENAGFASMSAFVRHVALSYRNVESYAKFERRPVDRKGIVKYDIAAICEALNCKLEDIFPADFIDTPYRFRESYDDDYGRRAKKKPIARYFSDRTLTKPQAAKVLNLIRFASDIPEPLGHAFAELAVRRLAPVEYAILARVQFEGLREPLRYGDSKRYERACRALNKRSNQELIGALKREHAAGGSRREIVARLSATEEELETANRITLTPEIRARIQELRNRSGLSPIMLLKWATRHDIPIPDGVTAQPLGNALSGRTKTIAAFLLEFAEETWIAAIEAKAKDSS
ncbi:hypothetical protein KAJ83_04450 [Marivibrio halodurans]|uniref:Uncharacterized protein n=1 Tax=Marivibrio halodurans TaxID=2039722 RepID=A0A8J7SKJ4_9PROT|nr:hypothetical protein [Marivibrio halodurans]MBP5856248.1 hypothetical protein [Marivibrio halodurans]